MKKFLTIITLIMSALLMFSFSACKGGKKQEERAPGLTYKTYDGVLTVVSYVDEKDGNGDDVTSLKAEDFKEGVGAIKAGAFKGNNLLKSIELPETIISIGSGAFEKMTKLESLTVPFIGENLDTEKTASKENTVFGTIFGTDEYDGGVKITQNYNGGSKDFYIPETLTEVNVIAKDDYVLPEYAFSGVGVVETITTENLTKISAHAFENAYDLTAFTVNDGVTEIGAYAFDSCTALKEFNFSSEDALTKIGEYAFRNSKLTEIVLPEGLTEMGNFCFTSTYNDDMEVINGTKLTKVTIPSTLTVIPAYAFFKCEKLTEVVIEGTLDSVKTSAFEGCISLDKVGSTTAKTINLGSCKVYTSAFAGLNRADYAITATYEVSVEDAFGEI